MDDLLKRFKIQNFKTLHFHSSNKLTDRRGFVLANNGNHTSRANNNGDRAERKAEESLSTALGPPDPMTLREQLKKNHGGRKLKRHQYRAGSVSSMGGSDEA
jgi:hypothetical protein